MIAGVLVCLLGALAGCGRSDKSADTAAVAAAHPDGGQYDLWIRNGTVVDGTGGDRQAADVLVRGDEIVFVGKVDGEVKAARTVDATGKFVTPGFIDAHSHGDPLSQQMTNFLAQGYTTVVLGQDGRSADTESSEGPTTIDAWRAANAAAADDGKAAPVTMKGWMERVDTQRSEVNIAALSGQGTLRLIAGVGQATKPTPEQLAAMEEVLRADLAAGSYGMSLGLEYDPGRYSEVDEQKALGTIVGKNNGIVMSHMRTEDTGKIDGAIDELLALDAHVHVSHMKIVAGVDPAEAKAVLDQMARARAAGKNVTGDVYPYLASAANLHFLYPEWAKKHPGDFEKAMKTRRKELEAHIRMRVEERLGPQAVLIVTGKHANKTIADVAKEMGLPYEKVILDELAKEPHQEAHFVMTPQVHDEFIRADHVSISTDGAPGIRHPRSYGSTAKILEEYVGDGAGKMSMERAVYKMSGLPAEIMGFKDRGTLRPGMKADILVLGKVHNRSTWAEPEQSPEGFDVVVVNGAVALEGGKVDGKHGRMLRHTAP